jgi:hypothetical protein
VQIFLNPTNYFRELAEALKGLCFRNGEQLRYVGLDRDVAAYLLGKLREGRR